MNSQASPRSWRFLLLLFIFALPVMMLLRWDSSVWLAEKADALAQQAGIDMTYDGLAVHGLALHFDGLTMRQAQHSARFDTLTISLAWSKLLAGDLAADVHLIWFDNPIHFTLVLGDGLLEVQAIALNVDLSKVLDIQQQLPVRLAGEIALTGAVTLDMASGLPQDGALKLAWSQAAAGLAAPEFEFGDYVLDVAAKQDVQAGWAWTIQGGSAVVLGGEGVLYMQGSDVRQWQQNGVVDVQVGAENAALSMMMKAFSGANQAKVRLSGLLLKPQVQVVH